MHESERPTYDNPDDVAALTRLDEAWNEAYVTGDRSLLLGILSDDFVGIAHTGQLISKAQLMQAPPEATVQVTFSEGWARCWGGTATTCGRICVRTKSTTIEHRFMRVYAKRGERWQAVAAQVVPLPDRPLPPPPSPPGVASSS